MINLLAGDIPTYLYIVLITGGAAIIALIVFLLRKFIPSLTASQNLDEQKDEKEIAEENISSRISSIEEEKKNSLDDNEEDELY